MLDWQHKDESSYNFILGIEKETGDIDGVIGFIRLSQFDSAIEPSRIIWIAIWKVRNSARGRKLGRNLLMFLLESEKPQTISTVAASAMTLPMYKALGYQVDRLKQYFIINKTISKFKLADIPADQNFHTCSLKNGTDLKPLSREELLNETQHCFDTQGTVPVKTPAYIAGRYIDHPLYSYDVHKIIKADKILGVIVTRVCEHDGGKAIRIVEFIGPEEAISGLYDAWQSLLEDKSAEYVDFYNAGIADSALKASGFLNVDDFEDLIIPNYFEPFMRKKVSIDFMISSPKGTAYRIVKGDSDQDRPNVLA